MNALEQWVEAQERIRKLSNEELVKEWLRINNNDPAHVLIEEMMNRLWPSWNKEFDPT